ncbi:MAG: hypothetical protein JXB20_01140 [Bacilli bacterium]|nr:hypothetical protein [Bacilli bacterium]
MGDFFMKILGVCIGLVFVFIGIRFLFRSTQVIQGIQKHKYKQIAKPRKQEIVFARIIGVLLMLIGLYFTIFAILSFFSDLLYQ